jgi:hypothetical protein
VPRARLDQFGEQFAGAGGSGEPRRSGRRWFLRGEEDLNRAGDLRRVAANGGTVSIEDGVVRRKSAAVKVGLAQMSACLATTRRPDRSPPAQIVYRTESQYH